MKLQQYNSIEMLTGEIGMLIQNFLSIKQSLVLLSTNKLMYKSEVHKATINRCLINIKKTDYEIEPYLARLKNLLPFIQNIKIPTIEYLRYFRASPLQHIKIKFFYNSSLAEVLEHKSLSSIDIDGLTDTKLIKLSDLQKLRRLKSHYCFFNFKHWQSSVNLKTLELSYSYILEFNKIHSLVRLEVLILNDLQKSACGIYDVDYKIVGGLMNLKYLNLAHNGVIKVEFLKSLQNLVKLELQRNMIENVSGIEQLSNLEFLNLGGNLIDYVPDLTKMKKLRVLILNNNQITDLSGICGLKSLKNLELHGNRIENIDCLTELKKLVQLDVSKNLLTGVDLGFELENLIIIDISFNRIRNLYGIGVGLETVVFDDHQTNYI